MVTDEGHRGIVCATDDVSARIEDLQLTLGEGPCIDVSRTGAPVLVADLDEPGNVDVGRWPAFMDGASGAGVRAVFAFPLRIGTIGIGVMDLYRSTPGELSTIHQSMALRAAHDAGLAVLNVAVGRVDAFADDLSSRSTYQLQVHQATGMVQVQAGVTTEEAFLLLRARAFSADRPLEAIATEVVERRLRFTQEDR
jgi:GAF domain/ANTAR domain